jgi:hypothetical protein
MSSTLAFLIAKKAKVEFKPERFLINWVLVKSNHFYNLNERLMLNHFQAFIVISTILLSVFSVKAQVVPLSEMEELFGYCTDHKFVVFGETHGIAVVDDVMLAAIKYALQKGRTLHVVLEMGKAQERILLQFLADTSNTTDGLWFPDATLHSLAELNNLYPNKLNLHGIDMELSLNVYIKDLIASAPVFNDDALQKSIMDLETILQKDTLLAAEKPAYRHQIKVVVEDCHQYLVKTKNTDIYANDLIDRGLISFKWAKKGLQRGFHYRDKQMYDRMHLLLKQYPNDYFYLQFGSDHVYQSPSMKSINLSLVPMLNRNKKSAFYQQVFSIGLGVVRCRGRNIPEEYTNFDAPSMRLDSTIINHFNETKAVKPTIYVWKPVGENTFDLYLIAEKYGAQTVIRPRNTLHLIF